MMNAEILRNLKKTKILVIELFKYRFINGMLCQKEHVILREENGDSGPEPGP